MAVLSANGKAVVAWETDRQTGNSDGYNIWMERVSDVFTPAYLPPLQTLMATGTTNGESVPAYLNGTTKAWTTLSQPVYVNPVGNTGATPIVSILDDYPLGFVKLKTYENTGAIRIVNGVPYLDRNILITVDNNPHGSGNIRMRFYIPQAQFDALKAADPSIASPADLGVVDQPSATTTAPSTYTPAGNEEMLAITGWGVLDGGYYVETVVHGFSNFFITKGSTPLPLKWLDVHGMLTTPTAATIAWTVTEEHNVKGYTVEYSPDGVHYLTGCSTSSGNSGGVADYSCVVELPAAGAYVFRVRQEDVDGKVAYSKTVLLSSAAVAALVVSPNPVSGDAIVRVPAGMTITKLILLSVDGRAVWQSAGAFNGTVVIPMGALAAGVYYLQAATATDRKVLEIIRR
ncbi:MAG: hypothetical protein JST42_03865 [Bacteroidetes bacterium]|nr:hypothetical protein [Bacteroidota bacterium]